MENLKFIFQIFDEYSTEDGYDVKVFINYRLVGKGKVVEYEDDNCKIVLIGKCDAFKYVSNCNSNIQYRMRGSDVTQINLLTN